MELVRATIVLIAERGLHGFSVGDIGLGAGRSRGLTGHHFKSKAALIKSAVSDLLTLSGKTVVLPTLDAFSDALGRALESLLKDPIRGRALATVLGAVHADAPYRAQVLKFQAERQSRIQANIEAGIATGEIRNNIQPDIQSQLILATMTGLAAMAADGSSTTDISTIVVEFKNYLMRELKNRVVSTLVS